VVIDGVAFCQITLDTLLLLLIYAVLYYVNGILFTWHHRSVRGTKVQCRCNGELTSSVLRMELNESEVGIFFGMIFMLFNDILL